MPDELEMPRCPRGHGSVKITFGGTYGGSAGPPRRMPKQLYKCVPADGSKPHRFAPLLPRRQRREARCEECESTVHFHEGPASPRQFTNGVRLAAQTLVRVASGMSYVQASEMVRVTRDRGGMLAADWVEAFTGDLWAALGPRQWPAFLVADSKPFNIRDWSQRANPDRPPGQGEKLPSKLAFTLAVVVGADAPRTPGDRYEWRPVLAMVFPALGAGKTLSAYDWCYLFSQLPGRPLGVTSDYSPAFFNAVDLWWPDDPAAGLVRPAFHLCVHHAKTNLWDKAVPNSVKNPYGPRSRRLRDDLLRLLADCAEDEQAWDALDYFLRTDLSWSAPVRAWRTRSVAGIPRHQIIHDQLAGSWPRGPDSNSVAEAALRDLTSTLGIERLKAFRNAERTNRLLRLMVLARRGDADERAWAGIIDRALRTPGRGGRPPASLRTVCDPAGHPSLR